MAMTKNDLIDILYDQAGLTKKECASVLESTIDIIKEELGKGNPVKIAGFGKWTVRHKKERHGRNPQTGEAMTLRKRSVVSFHSSPVLKKAMNVQ